MHYAIKNMFILNGHEDMQPESGKAIIVKNGIIESIVNESEIPEGMETVNLHGQYILPGLVNLHSHLPSSGKPKKGRVNYEKVAKLLKLGVVRSVVRNICANNAKTSLMSGTTTLRVVGGCLDFDTTVRDKINNDELLGPRLLAANYAVSVPGGHMTGSVALPVHSAEEAVKMVEDLDKTHPDLIKLMITGGVLDAEKLGEPGVLKMPPEFVKAACDKAHELGYYVAAHVEGNEGMVVALENGVDTIEHGGKPSEETTKLFKEKRAALVCTLSPAVPFAYLDSKVTNMSDTDIFNGKALLEHMVEGVKVALKEGIPVGLGTDAGCQFTTHYDMWREVWYYEKYIHVSRAFALYTATLLNSKIAKVDDVTGSIDEGKSADFMVVKDNPLDNLRVLRHPVKVVMKGKIIDDPQPKKYAKVETALDKILATQPN